MIKIKNLFVSLNVQNFKMMKYPDYSHCLNKLTPGNRTEFTNKIKRASKDMYINLI